MKVCQKFLISTCDDQSFLSLFQTQSDFDGLASCSSDEELEREQKRKARKAKAKNKKVKMNYAFDFVLSVDVKYSLHFQDKFEAKNRQDLDDDTEFDIEDGMAIEISKKSGKICIYDGASSLSKNTEICDDHSEICDDHSASSSESLIGPSENGDTPTRANVRFFHS